jgi:hypothetical protein
MNPLSWAAWAAVLFLQNISFTYVSRARSSGSLIRHVKASIFSNGIWIFSQMLMLGPLFDYLTGKHGHALQIMAASVYTTFCVSGSIFAHWWALRTEKGKNAVGFNKKYAQIPVEEWVRIQAVLKEQSQAVTRATQLAEQAYDVTVGMIPSPPSEVHTKTSFAVDQAAKKSEAARVDELTK